MYPQTAAPYGGVFNPLVTLVMMANSRKSAVIWKNEMVVFRIVGEVISKKIALFRI